MTPSPVGFEAAGAGKVAAASGSSRPKLEHAYLQLYEPSADGSLAKPGPALDRIEFQFNPRELTLAKAASWARQTGTGNQRSGPPQYNGPQPSTLALEMFFDASSTQDDSVVKRVDRLFACCVPTSASHDQKKDSPPWVLFRWGGLTGFLAYIGSVQAKYTLFTSSGVPIRAVCTVTLSELAGEAPRQNPTSGSPVPRRVHTLVEGDTLAGIAYREYGDPALWRALADANGLDNPFRLRPGSTVLVPALSELGPAGAAGAPRAAEVARAR
ncbi:LysM peptidoglycan-binding domain-containing protein [Georgenia faecalis]|uniref:LysM peptidoglycan-binding domain-containing protein n=1 Tax=Georgenia faecalis TaxID=2483799 RepID=A0ABV9DAV5_9MICO|nr:LysM peptidoglycan-binding domain-containing protein [Georgenia faecalis]